MSQTDQTPVSSPPSAVSVPVNRYERLLADQKLLRALQAGGVDNWCGYDESIRAAGLGGDDDEESEEDIYGSS
jgi:hypothetical protein